MKKISVVLIIVILFNFIFCNYISYADDEEDTITYSKEDYDQLTEEGTVNLNDQETEISISTSTVGSASGTVASIATPWFMIISSLLTKLATAGGITGGSGYTDLDSSAYNSGVFTICSLIFGEYLLFNVNVYQTNASLNPNIDTNIVSDTIDSLKETVVGWYYVMRLIAIAFILVLLIFTGIRMATAVLAEDKARYKQVIITWVKGLVFILLFSYIVVILNSLVQALVDVLWNIRYKMETEGGYSSFEYELLNICINGVTKYGGMQCLAYAIEYIAFIVIELLFFAKYFFRLVYILFMIVMAPIMAVMDIFANLRGRESVLKNWFKQYVMCLAIQPIHALIYLIFMFMTSEIAINAPLVGVIMLWVLLRAEKIVKIILKIDYGKVVSLFKTKR